MLYIAILIKQRKNLPKHRSIEFCIILRTIKRKKIFYKAALCKKYSLEMVFEYEARIPKSRHIFQEIVLQVQIIVKKIFKSYSYA